MHFNKKLKDNWINIEKMRIALKNSWGSDTIYPKDAQKWSQEVPSTGQCAVSSLVVQDYFGGNLVFSKDFNHFWICLDSDKLIDFTKDQFGFNVSFQDQINVKRRDILKGEQALEAKTSLRYKLLKNKVKKELKQLSPILLLFSSNANEEYILDILECFALPNNFVHHFRYQLTYLSEEIREILPLENEKTPKSIKNATVLIVYLKQSRDSNGIYKWEKAIPIRKARLVKAFRTGPVGDEKSIAHFYFQLNHHIKESLSFNSEIKEAMDFQYEKSYTSFIWAKKYLLFSNYNEPIPFESISATLNSIGYDFNGKYGLEKYSNPLYLFIHGIYKSRLFWKGHKLIYPKCDKITNKSYYKLNEAKQYFFKLSTYLDDDEKSHHFRVSLIGFKNNFVSPNIYTLDIKSQYDREFWEIVPQIVNQHTRSYLILKTQSVKCNNSVENEKKNLNLEINIPISIHRSWTLRLFEILSEMFIGFGTIYLALSKIYEKNKPSFMPEWYWVVPSSFLLGIILKIIIKVRRG